MISSLLAYFLLLGSFAFFAWLGYQESLKLKLDNDFKTLPNIKHK